MKLQSYLHFEDIGDELLVYDPVTAEAHRLDGDARWLVNCLRSGTTSAEIELQSRGGFHGEVPQQRLQELHRGLQALGLCESNFALHLDRRKVLTGALGAVLTVMVAAPAAAASVGPGDQCFNGTTTTNSDVCTALGGMSGDTFCVCLFNSTDGTCTLGSFLGPANIMIDCTSPAFIGNDARVSLGPCP